MAKTAAKTNGLFWKGLLANTSTNVRRMTAGVIAMMCVTCIFTQWGFVGVQFADGGASYLLFMLIPVALATLLLGTLPGVGMGLFAGAVLYLHARVMPLDYYELTYVTPVSAIVMTGICALVLGLLLSVFLKKASGGARRILLVMLACLIASAVLSAGFAFGAVAVETARAVSQAGLNLGAEQLTQTQSEAAAAALKAGNATFQAIGDAIIMSITVSAGLIGAKRVLRRAGEAGLREMFAARLFVAVLVAFMIVVMAAFGAVTAGNLADAQDTMTSEVDYLLTQVERTDRYNGKVYETMLELVDDPEEFIERFDEIVTDGALASVLEGYNEDMDGLTVIDVSGYVVGADTDRIESGNRTLDEYFDEDLLAAIDRSAEHETLERVVYVASSDYSDLVDFRPSGNREAFSSLLIPQVGYLMAAEHDGIRVTMIRPSSMVFEGRDAVVSWIALSTLVLLIATYVLARKLLDRMVARPVDATNETLQRITEGDLEVRVHPEGAHEFWDLAAGINVTVDALQDLIAESERRMAADLATAQAIQESALPSVFPPYPDIQRFDIYANMNAAKEVGGDFYDFFLLGDDYGPEAGKLAFVLADVSGKGIPASLFMMRAKTQIRDYLESGMELGEAIENANRRLCEGNDAGMFATAWVGVLDYATGHIDYVNAGHNPPLLWQDGEWHWMRQKSGLPLGLFEGLPYRTFSVDCVIGDQILIYTDGVTEAFSVTEEQYGEERLETLVNQSFDLHPRELVDRVRAGVAEHAEGAEQSDDITILALEIGVPPEEKAQITVSAEVEAIEQVYDFIHAELDRRLCPVRVQHQLDVAVEELFVNSCKHAYTDAGEGVEPYVRVTHAYSTNPSALTVEIIDDGVPFNPLEASEDSTLGGMGILMAKKSVDEMRYERLGESNVVTLVKRW